MAEQRETVGLSKGGHAGLFKNPAELDTTTLAELGIDKNLADRARKATARASAHPRPEGHHNTGQVRPTRWWPRQGAGMSDDRR